MNHTPPLSRYDSAPGSLLAGTVDSIVSGAGDRSADFSTPAAAAASEGTTSRFFSGDSSCCLTSESSCRTVAAGAGAGDRPEHRVGSMLQRSYRIGDVHMPPDLAFKGGIAGGAPHLVRHSSSPAGFLSHLLVDQGIPARCIVSYSQSETSAIQPLSNRRLSSQWSFSRQESLSQISELSIPEIGENISSDEAPGHVSESYISGNFQLGSWDDSNSIAFSASPGKRTRHNNGDIAYTLSNIESQYNLPKTSLEMSSVETYLQMQHDSVPCKVRAKRGCATHPRSIAERERRTRISKRLRKLQDLVPNMDKQASTSDMLELAIKHINELQNQIQKLEQDQANCTCGGKQNKA